MSPPRPSPEPNGPSDGDDCPRSPEELFQTVYRELRSVASDALRHRQQSHTLQPTALVHEAWLKLSGGDLETSDRGHFLSTAALAMRQVLSDHARAKRALKRGQRAHDVDPALLSVEAEDRDVDIVVLDDLLSQLSSLNARHARIVELRILGGLTMPEVADAIGVSLRTVESDWRFASAWLRSKLAPSL